MKLFSALVNAAAALLSSLLPIAAGLSVEAQMAKPQIGNRKSETANRKPQNPNPKTGVEEENEREGTTKEEENRPIIPSCCPQNSAPCDSGGYGTRHQPPMHPAISSVLVRAHFGSRSHT